MASRERMNPPRERPDWIPEEARRWPEEAGDGNRPRRAPRLAGSYPRPDERTSGPPLTDGDESYTAGGVTYRREPARQAPSQAMPYRPARRVPDRTYMHGEGYAGGREAPPRYAEEEEYDSGWQPPGERTFLDRASDEVASWFGDRDAGRRRNGDAVLRGQHRGRGPKSYIRPDERIREDVCDRLTDDQWIDASEIDVSVAGGEVTLSGYVNNREDKHWAEECAESVSGVTHVQNNLRVKPVGDRAMTPGSDQTPV